MPTESKMPNYGGQALMEGVLMRGSKYVAMAVRSPEGEILRHVEKLEGIYTTNIRKWPFVRGVIALWDALGLGMRFLTMSANVQTDEDEDIEGPMLFITLLVSILMAVGLFFLLPTGLSYLVERFLNPPHWVGNLIEGAFRLVILIGYMWVISLMKDIQRVYSYHGAEHKVINAFENNAELTPESAAQCSIEHPRCGTAFMLTLVIISVIFFTLLGPMSIIPRLIVRVLAIPILAGIAYEYQRWTANNLDKKLVQMLIKPNLALQKLSTKEPSLDMLEVSLASFKLMKEYEEATEEKETFSEILDYQENGKKLPLKEEIPSEA